MWTYHHEVGSQQEVDRTMVFVLVKEGKYDGYLWFSTHLLGGR